jgi:hypothetical protein
VSFSDGFIDAHFGGFIAQHDNILLPAPLLQGIGHIGELIIVRGFIFSLLQLLDLLLSFLEFLLENLAFDDLVFKLLLMLSTGLEINCTGNLID